MAPSEDEKQQQMLATIEASIREIIEIIRGCSTLSVALRCLMETGDPRPELHSPAKQLHFLLGLLVATDDPPTGREFSDNDWKKTAVVLQRLFSAHMVRYQPDAQQFAEEPYDWFRNREITILNHINHFQQTILATPEQLEHQISAYATPFDNQLAEDFGISATDALAIAKHITSEAVAHLAAGVEPMDAFAVRRSNLVSAHGRTGDSFWKLFTVGRGEGNQLNYPTEKSIVDDKPLVRLSEETAFLSPLRGMLLAMLARSEDALIKSSRKRAYFRHRAKVAEQDATSTLEKILGAGTRVYRSLFETPNGHYEHDAVLLNDEICLFIEVKSTPPTEPFRDPDKAFIRLEREFRSDTGIQTAYNQALRLVHVLRENEECVLYNRQGSEALRLPKTVLDKAFCVCVTRDSHGPVATCLSFLLERQNDDPYPWVASTLDLQNILEAWQYYKWDVRQFKAFLRSRLQLHTNLLGNDELDYVGAYIRHCGLHHFIPNRPFVNQPPAPLSPTYSEFVDGIHDHLFRGKPRFKSYPVYPRDSDIVPLLVTGASIWWNDLGHTRIKEGPNKPCPCGSGVKFKRCHGML